MYLLILTVYLASWPHSLVLWLKDFEIEKLESPYHSPKRDL